MIVCKAKPCLRLGGQRMSVGKNKGDPDGRREKPAIFPSTSGPYPRIIQRGLKESYGGYLYNWDYFETEIFWGEVHSHSCLV